ncbi:MAG: hypothetical protein JXR83_14845 [Deltaproteobacteria bacterium]|nr:hypothetical protein [Deltaproteobacteria bacterium]
MHWGFWSYLVVGLIGGILFLLFAVAMFVKAFYRIVSQGQALIVNKTGKKTIVTFNGGTVFPIIHRAEVMDISLKTIEIDRKGTEGLICRDNIRADIKVTFFVRVNMTEQDVLKVAQSIGCQRASAQQTIEELFSAKFSEALKTVGYGMDFVQLYDQREQFRDAILKVIGTDLNGYVLEDAAIDFLEQTPLESLDPKNILDAQGIKKITELTSTQAIKTNEYENNKVKQIKKQDVEAKEAVLALDRQQEAAIAAQQREIASVRAREAAEAAKVQAEENQKAQLARIKSEEEISVANEVRLRQVAVAEKNKERAVKVEIERVEKDRALEAINRERETELTRIEKEKQVEKQKKEIADIIRTRVAVEKTVAEEEERIKDVRALCGANRDRDVVVVHAEAEAQEALVKDIKRAEAQARAAEHQAKQRMTLAEAELEAADREAKAKIRQADGTQAQVAAPGMAEVKVKEADAVAIEKKGMAEARVLKEKMLSEANGSEAKGLAGAKVQEALATALLKTGQNEAVVIKDKGTAEATAIEQKLTAEANGLNEKAAAMKSLNDMGRGHEEFRLQLDKEKTVELRSIEIRREIAEAQARVLAEAFKTAKIDIVGGDGAFFDRFIRSISVGKSIDGFFDKSEAAQKLLEDYFSGERSLPADLKEVLQKPALSAESVQKLTLSALLTKVMASSDEEKRGKVAALIEQAKKLGVDKLTT